MKALRTLTMAVTMALGTYAGGEAMAQDKSGNIQFPTERQQSADTQSQDQVVIANDTYTIKYLRVVYDRARGEIQDMEVEGWQLPAANDTKSGLKKVYIRTSTEKNGKVSRHDNNNAIEFKQFRFENPRNYSNPNARVEFSIQPSGWADKDINQEAFITQPEPDANLGENNISQQAIKKMTFQTQGNFMVQFIDAKTKRPFDNPQDNANQLISEGAVYGMLLSKDNFIGVQKKEFDRENKNKKSTYVTQLIPAAPHN